MDDKTIRKLANCKIGEWKACGRGILKIQDLQNSLITLVSLQYGLSRDEAKDVVLHRIKALEYCYKAEDFEADDNQEEAEHNWRLAKQSMVDYYDMLYLKIERKKKGPV